ncbi:MAG TPA: type I phosphomannose isomerase catalytic subunit [Acidothermaceae bacterium]
MHVSANNFTHFYAGGRSIARFRGLSEDNVNSCPEDWVASTTTRFGAQRTGLSEMPDGGLLTDLIDADPTAWLGAEHHGRFGSDTCLLVKLLDVEERLIVHAHPDREFARHHLGCSHGKTEAWFILETTATNPVVYVGFREPVDADILHDWVLNQRTDLLLRSLNEIPVAVGDVILVPAGVPHAVGGGVFIAEVQEPTDFSIALEWEGYNLDGRNDGHLGLGFDVALDSVDRSAWPAERLRRLFGPIDDNGDRQELLPSPARPFFRVERVRDGAVLEPSFAVLIVTEGSGWISTAAATVPVRHGQSLVVPYAAGASTVAGPVTALRFLPPLSYSAALASPAV